MGVHLRRRTFGSVEAITIAAEAWIMGENRCFWTGTKELQEKFGDVHPFLLYKWERIFKTILDSNASNEIDSFDYYYFIRRVKQIYGNDSQQTEYATSALKALFQGLIEKADKNNDTRVTTEEFIDLMKTCNPRDNHTWYNDYCISMFKLFDVSGDQKLDIAEYADGMQTYGVHEHASHEAFRKFAKDSKGKPMQSFNLLHFKKLWDEYFYSIDPKSLGNDLFGILE